ncbi:MAG: four helix bundle protein [Patescibacteria group bacterium]|jgi:four helix bundle protein
MNQRLKGNVLAEKSYTFALNIIKVYQALIKAGVEPTLVIQLLKSGTSIGANVREAIGAQSRAEFIAKLSIAYKESLETDYWLSLFKDTGILHEETANSLIQANVQIASIISKSSMTAKQNR